jgi:hypothetical protein
MIFHLDISSLKSPLWVKYSIERYPSTINFQKNTNGSLGLIRSMIKTSFLIFNTLNGLKHFSKTESHISNLPEPSKQQPEIGMAHQVTGLQQNFFSKP